MELESKIEEGIESEIKEEILKGQLEEEILREQDKYVNGEETKYDDETFDAVVEYRNRHSKEELKLIGAEVKDDKEKVRLEYPMPSLNKITHGKNDLKELKKFISKNKGPYIISNKVDGTSLQLVYKDGNLKIFTGGNGIEGFEVTHIKNYVLFPEIEEDIVIRGELTICNKDFEKLVPKLKKQGLKAKNSRTIVNAMVNRKEINEEVLSKCFFVAFGILSSDKSFKYQFKKLKKLGFELPNPELYELENEEKEEEFLEFLVNEHTERKNLKYRTDGIVIASEDSFYQLTENENPSYMFAFKKNTVVVTEVIEVQWNVSRHGYLTPVAIIEPVEILGQNFERASVYNAREVVSKGIGKGAIVSATLSGDIIPALENVIVPGIVELPEDCHWNANEVELIIDNIEESEEVVIRQMDHFLGTIGVKNCGIKMLEKIYNSGIDSIEKLVRARVEEFMEVERMGEKSSKKLHKEIQSALDRITWPKLMAGCGIFPELIGINRCVTFVNAFPDFRFEEITKEQIIEIEGFGEILAEKMADNLPKFKKWIAKNKMCQPKIIKKEKVEKDLQGHVFVFTGITASDVLKEQLNERGAIVKDTFVKNTTLVIRKDDNFESNKTREAREKEVKIVNLAYFLKKISKK